MNSRQLQYAIELSKNRNFSQVSEKLKISQPALSKQILHLEEELGVKLFDRNTVPFTVTPAGEHFIRQAQVLLLQEELLLRSMEQFKAGERGRVTIGISPFRNVYLMPGVIQRFKEKYPDVQVILQETNSDQLRMDAEEGKYDFAIVNLPVNEAILNVTLLEKESLVLAVPNSLLPQLFDSSDKIPSSINFSKCKDLPFVVVSQSQEMRRYFDQLCASCDIIPNITVEVAGGISTAWSMARAGLGATLLPLAFAGDVKLDRHVTLFMLEGIHFTRQPAIVTRKGNYTSEFAQYAIDLIVNPQSL